MSGSELPSGSSSLGAAAEQDPASLDAASDVGVDANANAATTPAAPTPPRSSWSTLYPVLKLKGWGRAHGSAAGGRTPRGKAGTGFSAPLSSRLRGSDASSVGMDNFSVQYSSRSRGSDASVISNTSSKASGTVRRGKRVRERKGRTGGSSVFSASSAAARIKAEAKRGEALLEPLICPRQRQLKKILEESSTLRPLAVRLTNLSYWYQQRRLLGGFRHMHRRTEYDSRSKRWEASLYTLGDRPSDGKLVPILTPIKPAVGTIISTEGQALALAVKSAKQRDANPGAVRGPKPPGMTQLTMLQTHISILVVSDSFEGLSHADRLALVFTAIHDELAATSPPPPPPPHLSRASAASPRSPSKTPLQPSSSSTTRPATPRAKHGEASAIEGNQRREDTSADLLDLNNQSIDAGGLSLRHSGTDGESGGGEEEGEEARISTESRGERGEGEDEGAAEEEADRDRQGRDDGDGKDAGSGRDRDQERVGDPREGNDKPRGAVRRADTAPTPIHDLSANSIDPGAACPADDGSGKGESCIDNSRLRCRRPPRQHRSIRGGVKASYVGPNVEALPVWGALDAIAGSSLLVDCRTPAQWRADEYRPTAQELWGPARSGHRTLANSTRVGEASVRGGMERIIAEGKLLREAAPKFEHFDRFGEAAGAGTSGDGGGGGTPRAAPPAASPRANGPATAFVSKAHCLMKRTHPHFFHGLGPNARKLFMELYAENRSRLLAPISSTATANSVANSATSSGRDHHAEQASSAAPPDGSSLPNLAVVASSSQQPSRQRPQQASPRSMAASSSVGSGGSGGAAANVRHAAGAFAAAGPPPDLDAAIMDRYGVLLARLTEAAIRIQRARRLGGIPRAARRLRRRQRAALAVQRVFRGHLGRRYASIWKAVSALASTRLSAGWRRFIAQREFLVFRARARKGAIGLQALFRGHVARRYAAWCAAHYFAARHIQRGGRGFTARCRARRMRATRAFELCGLSAILLVQKTIRGFLVRKAYERRFQEALRVRVIIPAAGVLQKCWRGKKGREEAALRRRMWAAATEIQRHARGLSKRMWWARVLRCRLEHAMATRIEAVGRGYIDRELVKARRAQRYFLHTITPACILIQSQWRGYTRRRDLAMHKQRWLAALFIQVAYRGALFRRKARLRYQEWLVRHKGVSATKIQCLFRKWQSRQLYRIRNVEASWRRTFATRIILRTWRSYKMNLAMDELKEQWRVEKAALELADAQNDIKDIKDDLELCLEDIAAVKKSIKNAKRRIKDLREFRKEAALRLPRVERLIENLTVQDMAGGWGENYDREWDMLSSCMSMAVEEERIVQVKIAKLELDLQILKLEIDDQEEDLDASSSREFNRMEALRRMEISRGLGLARRDRIKAVRRERMRWAVRDVRRNVIKRSRKDLQGFRELARAQRPLEVEHTISYEKRRDQERDEEAEVRRMEREARKERFLELKKKGEGSLAIREVYDAVISGVRDIIATATFEARRAKQDYRGRGPDEVGPAASAAATAAAATARKVAIAAAGRRGIDGEEDAAAAENAAAAAAAAAATAAAVVGGAEPGGGRVCRECGGPRFGRTVCAKCGANANSWRGGVESEGED
eukprot:g16349.t1